MGIETGRPHNQKVAVNFYKVTGKWYSGCVATVNHNLSEDGFKQDIVDTQDALTDGWQNHVFFVTTGDSEPVTGQEPFVEHLFMPGAFAGFRRTTPQ